MLKANSYNLWTQSTLRIYINCTFTLPLAFNATSPFHADRDIRVFSHFNMTSMLALHLASFHVPKRPTHHTQETSGRRSKEPNYADGVA